MAGLVIDRPYDHTFPGGGAAYSAEVLAEQVVDNCLVAAGLLDDGRTMLPRLNDLMLCIVKNNVKEESDEKDSKKES